MGIEAIITLIIILIAVILLVGEWISYDVVALMIIVALVVSGVLSPQEGVMGFSNHATVTIIFMFIISAAILKTGAMQFVTFRLAKTFRKNFTLGILLLMFMIAVISAFVNNTPVVAVFIPVVIQIAHASGQNPSKMLIPMSFASIFGGSCTLIGTSTNLLVSGIAEKEGLESISMFAMAPIGLIFLVFGVIYMVVFGIRLLPKREQQSLKKTVSIHEYMTEIELLEDSEFVGQSIMNSLLVKELEMDIVEVRRKNNVYSLPPGDFVLRGHDILKVRCDVQKMRSLKDRLKIANGSSITISGDDLRNTKSTLVEMVITSNSDLDEKTLKESDFRRRYRAIPLAVRHREEVLYDQLYNLKIKSGDVILAEVKTHYLKELKKREQETDSPFVILSEDEVIDFDRPQFLLSLGVVVVMVLLATFGVVDIMLGAIAATSILVLFGNLSMREAYESVNWKIIFLLAGALSMGTAMNKTGLDVRIAEVFMNQLGTFGPVAMIGGLYLLTSILTSVISNNATAALLTPIAIAISIGSGLNPMPFIMTIMFAASASFISPLGYQTNTMVYGAGGYRFSDFFKVGIWLNLLFLILAVFLIPLFFPF